MLLLAISFASASSLETGSQLWTIETDPHTKHAQLLENVRPTNSRYYNLDIARAKLLLQDGGFIDVPLHCDEFVTLRITETTHITMDPKLALK